MKTKKIYDQKTGGFYTICFDIDFEFVNPIDYYKDSIIKLGLTMQRDMLILQKMPFPPELIEKRIHKKALELWDKRYQEIMSAEVPTNLYAVLISTTKKEQVKLLKGVQIDPDQLLAFLFKAWQDYGFKFSQYTTEHLPTGTDKKGLPIIINIEGGDVKKIGKTKFTDGQLKQVVEHRQGIVAKFLDINASWHCLFTTFNSLKGVESWKGGQPHFHYISDKFGLSRDQVINELKNRNYKLGSLPHIDLLKYRL